MSGSPPLHGDNAARKSVHIAHQQVDGGVHINLGNSAEERSAVHTPPRYLPPRQPTFAGRERELRVLHECFARETAIGVTQQAAVHSHGGVGKTSLATEYGWRYLEEYPGGVFFLPCERAPVPPLAEIAPHLGIRATGNAEELAALVKTRLETGGPALLILDNVEGNAQWRGGQWSRLLPQSPCRWLVTTRASQLAGARMIPLERLSAEDGLELLANFRPDAAGDADAARIVEWFDGLAVGLTVVGVYMQMNPGLTWTEYARDLQARGLDVVRATEAEVDDAMEYEGRAASVFNDVLQALPGAERRAVEYAALLPEDNVFAPWLLDLLDSDGVEVSVRPGYADEPVRQVVDALIARQLLRPRGEDTRVLGLHRVLRRYLSEAMGNELRSTLMDRIEELAEKRGQASREVVTEVGLRAELAPLAALAETLDGSGRTAAGVSLTNWVAESLRLMGRYPEARALVDRFIGSEKQFAAGREEAEILLTHCALILSDQGEASEARHRLEQTIELREQHLEPDHPALANSYSSLGTVLGQLGELPEAQRRMEQAIAIYEHHLPPEHLRLAISYSNLALILLDLGEFMEARRRMEQAIAIQEQHGQSDSPDLARSFVNLAAILQAEDKLPEARHRVEQAIAIFERFFQPDHPNLGTAYNNLGAIVFASGDHDGACTLLRRADAIFRTHFPPDHPYRQSTSKTLTRFCGEVQQSTQTPPFKP